MPAQLPRGDLLRVMAGHPMAGLELHQLRPVGVAEGVLRHGQRVWNRQPLGGFAGDGRSPVSRIRSRVSSTTGSGTGTADISALVYGCSGSRRGRRSRPPRPASRGTSRRPGRRCAGPPRGRGRSPGRSGRAASCRSSSRLITWACTDTSSADTGSSATIRSGLTVSARAMPIRCRWPPENSCGYLRSALAGSPTEDSSSRSRALVEALSGVQPVRLHALDQDRLHRLPRVQRTAAGPGRPSASGAGPCAGPRP